MLEAVSSLRTRLAALLLLVACTLPLAGQEEGEEASRECCHGMSLDVYTITGDRDLAEEFYRKCNEAWCIEFREEQEGGEAS